MSLAPDLPVAVQARVWESASIALRWNGQLNRAWELGQRTLEVWRQVGDSQSEAWSLRNLGAIADEQGELEVARSLFEQAASLFLELGDPHGLRTIALN